MTRRANTRDSVFSVFDSLAWKNQNIATVPQNFVSKENKEFIRVSIVDSARPINRVSVSGLVLIDIYAASGKGPKRFDTIADLLDSYLLDKSIKTSAGLTQFGVSNMSAIKPDPANTALAVSRYTIPFNHFEVI